MNFKFLFSVVIFLFIMLGCSPDDDPIVNNKQPVENSGLKDECNNQQPSKDKEDYQQLVEDIRYYVKYEVYMPLGSGYETSTSRKITFISEMGKQSFSTTSSSWEGIYGPFSANTMLYIEVEAESGGIQKDIEYYVKLSVSRNKEPFTIKREKREKNVRSIFTRYTIN